MYEVLVLNPKHLGIFGADIVYNSVIADRSFSLRAVFRIIQQRVSQMCGTFSPR